MNNTTAQELFTHSRKRRVFWNRNKSLILKSLGIGLIIGGMIILWITSIPRMNQYNKYMCAVYGYQADCQTPLAPEDRLK